MLTAPGLGRDGPGGAAGIHVRTHSNASSLPREHSPSHFHSGGGQYPYLHHGMRRGSGQDEEAPPGIRQTRSEVSPSARRGNHGNGGGSSSSNASYASSKDGGGGAGQASHHDESSKNGYALWLPWEETALVEWLFKPENCRLFNIPRRKKECHERIIQEILPGKTSRAIEGKIRTLEKRYLKAASEIQRPDFAAKHPGKKPDEVAEALCNNFHKLETIFNPAQAQARSHLAPLDAGAAQDPKKRGLWTSPQPVQQQQQQQQPHESQRTVSVPRSSSPPPPRIAAAESLPLPYRIPAQERKIAPKRGAEAATDADSDVPVMMSGGKRSRTLPSVLQNRRSPGRQQQQQQHMQPPHRTRRSPLLLQQITLQQAQQQRFLDNSGRYAYDAAVRPSTATLPMIPTHSPIASTSGGGSGGGPMAATVALTAGTQQPWPQQQPQQQPQLTANATAHEPDPSSYGTAQQAAPGAVQGTREELEWLQLGLRRDELEFRKMVFVHDQELETKRVRLEEHRLENQRREMELETRRMDVQKRQIDVQIESLKSLTSMLGQMVGQMGTLLGASQSRLGPPDVSSSADAARKPDELLAGSSTRPDP
ncbi:hypothetical protein GGF46_002204 [Coemansia sp. RSA 552]|nr:hypothetical protein GGF46_002204 [Coemansia sp. RSA 552]